MLEAQSGAVEGMEEFSALDLMDDPHEDPAPEADEGPARG
jgi:hypothetical protein